MNLRQLIEKLERLRTGGSAGNESPVIIEGYDDDGGLIQRSVESVTTEARCEGDDEIQAVYINLADESCPVEEGAVP